MGVKFPRAVCGRCRGGGLEWMRWSVCVVDGWGVWGGDGEGGV